MQDRFRNRYRVPKATHRLRQQIAIEAAQPLVRRWLPGTRSRLPDGWMRRGANDLYVAKRKAAAVLGHRIRPGDLPSDDEVRNQLVVLWRGPPAGRSDRKRSMTTRRR